MDMSTCLAGGLYISGAVAQLVGLWLAAVRIRELRRRWLQWLSDRIRDTAWVADDMEKPTYAATLPDLALRQSATIRTLRGELIDQEARAQAAISDFAPAALLFITGVACNLAASLVALS